MSDNMQVDPKIRQQVANELGLYVYMLVDPETGIPFYVGKGQGERFAIHGNDAMLFDEDATEPDAKIARIQAIRSAGGEPEIWILRHGMSSKAEYTSVEAACIDLLQSMPVVNKPTNAVRLPEGSSDQLTNARREAAKGHGIMLLQDLYEEMAAPLLTTRLPLLIVSLGEWVDSNEPMLDGTFAPGYGYKTEWLTSVERVKHYQEIADSAAKWFKFTEREVERRGIEYALAAHRGVSRALLKIIPGSWQHTGSGRDRRSGFRFEIVTEGAVFNETVGEFGHRLPTKKRGEQSTFRYWPYSQSTSSV